jgi:beta-glucanase (GH16 family)
MRLLFLLITICLLPIGLYAQKKVANASHLSSLKLVWSDEFNTGNTPDTSKWNYNIGNGEWGWGNNEQQYYTKDASNVRIENGKLIIEARKEDKEKFKYTSARMLTQGKASWTYGRFEIRAKLPKGMGTWPAIWMLGDNIKTVGWPACGEIDIMEEVWKEPNVINWSTHSKMLNWPKGTQKTYKAKINTATDQFHVYRLDWSEKSIQFYVDNRLYYTVQNDGRGKDYYPFVDPQFLLVNLAIGGNMPGQTIDDTIFPVRMELDYVRVYQ